MTEYKIGSQSTRAIPSAYLVVCLVIVKGTFPRLMLKGVPMFQDISEEKSVGGFFVYRSSTRSAFSSDAL